MISIFRLSTTFSSSSSRRDAPLRSKVDQYTAVAALSVVSASSARSNEKVAEIGRAKTVCCCPVRVISSKSPLFFHLLPLLYIVSTLLELIS